MARPLTPRRQAFVKFYARYGQGARLARDAGFSHAQAKCRASMLLKLPEIQTALLREQARVAKLLGPMS